VSAIPTGSSPAHHCRNSPDIPPPAGVLVALVNTGAWLWLAGFGWLSLAWRTGIGNVIGVSLRQQITPDALLGRMNATFRFLLTGAIAVGAGMAGLLGQYASAHLTLGRRGRRRADLATSVPLATTDADQPGHAASSRPLTTLVSRA
jgi:hypothetical protein